jgi:hypothetical protein
METWQKYIEEFNITKTIIPHRDAVWTGPKFAEIELGGAWDQHEEPLEPLKPIDELLKELDIEDIPEEEDEEDPRVLEIMRKYGGLAMTEN